MTLIDTLSEREKEVANLLLQGKSNKQIAQELGVTTRTVEFHVTHIYEKLGVKSRAEAIVRLSEPQLRESTGTAAAQTTVDLRQPTVEKATEASENRENISFSFRRRPVKKILLIIAALIAIPCLAIGLIWAGGLALFMVNPVAKAGQVREITQVVEQVPYTSTAPTPTAPTPIPYDVIVTPTPIQPTPTPWESQPEQVITSIVVQDLGGSRYRFEGVEFTLDPALGKARGELVLENPETPNSPFWEVSPQHIRLSVDGYPLADTFWSPVIRVYPVEEYRRMSPLAAQTLDQLQARLEQKPRDPGAGMEANPIPFLPLINAGQTFHSNVEYLDFQNGTGVRFLAVYAQYPAAVNNKDLFYTYQGLTADGRHMLSIILPVSHPSLPASEDLLGIPTLEAIAQNYGPYREQAYAALNGQPGSSFTPDLSVLDALAQSIKIDR